MDPTADLERMERKIRGSEARAAALTEMGDDSYSAQFRELDVDSDIEMELQLLKGGNPIESLPASTTTDEPEAPAIPSSSASA
jgi:hypothetical protein